MVNTEKGVKLTKVQERELRNMAGRAYRSYYVDYYAPIKRLLELGYVDRWETEYGSTYAITSAGRLALAQSEGE